MSDRIKALEERIGKLESKLASLEKEGKGFWADMRKIMPNGLVEVSKALGGRQDDLQTEFITLYCLIYEISGWKAEDLYNFYNKIKDKVKKDFEIIDLKNLWNDSKEGD